MSYRSLFVDLSKALAVTSAHAGADDFVTLVQSWARLNIRAFGPALRGRYLLDYLTSIDLAEYPIRQSSLDPQLAVRRVHAGTMRSVGDIAEWVRDVIWEGATIESGTVCPACGDGDLRLLWDPSQDAGALSCDVCAWTQVEGGGRWQATANERLVAPVRAQVDRWNAEHGVGGDPTGARRA